MNRRVLKFAVAGAIVAALALGGAAWAIAGGGDDGEGSVTGPDADRAKAAALARVGGTANAVERDNEDGATWEVEVTKANGETVDVRLDANFKVVTVEGDSESPDDDDGGADD